MQDYKDGSGLQFINFDFVTARRSRNQTFYSVGIFSCLAIILSFGFIFHCIHHF